MTLVETEYPKSQAILVICGCGGQPEIIDLEPRLVGRALCRPVWIRCRKCGAQAKADNLDSAVLKWNRCLR